MSRVNTVNVKGNEFSMKGEIIEVAQTTELGGVEKTIDAEKIKFRLNSTDRTNVDLLHTMLITEDNKQYRIIINATIDYEGVLKEKRK